MSDQEDRPEPFHEIGARFLENRACNDGSLMTTIGTFEEQKLTRGDFISFVICALWTS
jgi:hypothetical protein